MTASICLFFNPVCTLFDVLLIVWLTLSHPDQLSSMGILHPYTWQNLTPFYSLVFIQIGLLEVFKLELKEAIFEVNLDNLGVKELTLSCLQSLKRPQIS